MKCFRILCFVSFFLIITQSHGDITILESNSARLIFDWKLGSFDTISGLNEKVMQTRLSFSEENMTLGESGEPVLPGRSIFFGVPQAGTVQVELSPEEVSSIQLTNSLVKNKIQKEVRHSELTFNQQFVSNVNYQFLHDFRTGVIVIRPFVPDQVNGSVSVLKKARITITFPPSQIGNTFVKSSAYTRMVQQLLINFDIAKNWTGSHSRLSKTASSDYPLTNTKTFPFRIGDGNSGFNEATTNENGLVKITGNQIGQKFGPNIPIDKVILYASLNQEMKTSVPEMDQIPTNLTEIPLMRFDMNKNGIVDTNDFFIAYVTGNSDWFYVGGNKFEHYLNRLDDYRHYWVTIKSSGSGLSIDKFNTLSGVGDTVNSITNKIRLKQSSSLPLREQEGSLNWVKSLRNDRPEYLVSYRLSNMDKSVSATASFNWESPKSGLTVTENNTEVCSECNRGMVFSLTNNDQVQIKLSLIPKTINNTDTIDISPIDIEYLAKLDISGTSPRIDGFSRDSGIVTYKLTGLRSELAYIMRISPTSIQLIDTVRARNGVTTFTWTDTGGKGVKYFICTSPKDSIVEDLGAIPPVNPNPIVINDLRVTMSESDLLIVTHRDFIEQALLLAEHKKTMGFRYPKVVDIENVYRYFSGGSVDHVALRNFLFFVRNYWTSGKQLEYVILFGNGNYDIKRVASSEKTYIPTAQVNQKNIEDFFSYLVPGQDIGNCYPQLYLGRIPCTSASEAAGILDKIKEIENPQSYGPWRNRALFVADDDMQGDSIDKVGRTVHTESSDKIALLGENLRPSLDIRKVYLFEYPWNIDKREKPEATQALVNEINNGVGYVNFFGHGAPGIWTDEHIFTVQNNDIGKLYNRGKYPIVTSFSCSVGQFDNPKEDCLSDRLVRAPGAGAIVAIGATRLAYANNNEVLAKVFYSSILDSSVSNSVGMSYTLAKVRQVSDGASNVYALLGDPTITMCKPQRKVSLQILDSKGNELDTVQALQQIKVKGLVVNAGGNTDTDFGKTKSAFVNIGFYNPDDSASRKDGGTFNARYVLSGTPVFTGVTQVVNGTFEQEILIPRNVAFDKPGIRLCAYVWQDSVVGLGSMGKIIFHGTSPPEGIKDSSGPRITIRPVYDEKNMAYSNASVSGKISSTLPANMRIDLYDPSGIDVVGVGPDEGLTMEMPGVISKRNYNHKFQFSQGDFRSGSASITFEEGSIRPGIYTLNVSALDLLGNISQKTFTLEILADGELTLENVCNYPNPMKMGQGTKFYFFHSNTTSQVTGILVQATVRIYTMGGKLIKVIKNARNGEPWDGRDHVGNVLTPNIYLYQIIAESQNAQKVVKSDIKKIVIHPPR